MRRRQVERDLDDEIAYHLECETERRVGAGMDPTEARQLVSRRFGSVERIREQCRDARGLVFVEAVAQDLRYGVRTLRRDPAFAAVAILTLALGIGGNTAVFSLVDGILLSPLPYPAPERLVGVSGTYPNGAFAAMRGEIRSMDVGAYAEGHAFTLTGNGEPARLTGARVSAELFRLLGVQPELGRWLRPGEDQASRDALVILSHPLWESRFKADPSIVGRYLELDGVKREVIAVMPAEFRFPAAATELWVPLGIDPANPVRQWAGDYMPVVGRLRPGATAAQAHAELRVFQAHLPERFPWPMPAEWNRDVSVVPLREVMVGDVRSRLLILMGAAALVLLIACANVTNLGLSKAAARQHEIGIRTAIGAGPVRIARQLLTESLVLALLGAAVGLLLATQGLAVLKLVLPPDTPRLGDAHLNWRVLAFTGVVAFAAGCAAGLVPALQTLRLRVRTVLRPAGRGGRAAVAGPFRAVLTIAQIASAVLLVTAAGLLVRSLWSLARVDPGFGPDGIVTARLSPTEALCTEAARCLAFYRTVEERVGAAPGVGGAALVNTPPLTGSVAKRSLELENHTAGGSGSSPLFWLNAVTADYFRVMQIRVESGRAFTPADLRGQPPVAVVTSSTARRFWPGQNPIGKHVRFVGESSWHTIVGVVSDVRAFDLTRSVPDWMDGALYVPYGPAATQEDGRIPTSMTLTVRTAQESTEFAGMLRRLVSDVSHEVVVSDVKDLRTILVDSVAASAATTSLLVTMAALALVLGCVGIYGVLSFLVSSQTREVGIRLALGAQRRDIFRLVMTEGARLCAAGIGIGLAGALAASRWMSSQLYGVRATDPSTYAAVAVTVALVTLAACYVPTRRAMKVDPLTALREP